METIEKIKKDFEDYVIQQNLALAEGNGKKANRFHKKIQNLYRNVRDINRVDIFKDYLNDKNESVTLWAAGLCLKEYPEVAQKKLVELSKSSDSMICLSAKATLEFYMKGMWDKLISFV